MNPHVGSGYSNLIGSLNSDSQRTDRKKKYGFSMSVLMKETQALCLEQQEIPIQKKKKKEKPSRKQGVHKRKL